MMNQQNGLSRLIIAASLGAMAMCQPSGMAQTPASSGATLADTLSWLQDFLPRATGASNDTRTGGRTMKVTEHIEISGGCNVRLLPEIVNYRNGITLPPVPLLGQSFSLADIDPSTYSVYTDSYPLIALGFATKGRAKVIVIGNDRDDAMAAMALDGFVDSASPQRVLNALVHASELCANAQPF